jgi:hypothetical protein
VLTVGSKGVDWGLTSALVFYRRVLLRQVGVLTGVLRLVLHVVDDSGS